MAHKVFDVTPTLDGFICPFFSLHPQQWPLGMGIVVSCKLLLQVNIILGEIFRHELVYHLKKNHCGNPQQKRKLMK